MPLNQSQGKSTQPGRPAFISNLVVLKAPNNQSAFEMAKTSDPEVMQQAKAKYMGAGQSMPTAFMSRRVSPTGAQENRRRRAISKGFV